ncbi:SGNH/GDSL hydrolase family protein [Aporhodopirellula aestuarii]|uniref:SGNH/GDSL hydrolase family protein n=1 Tax=Aporhodopirellula aestuarii TaxID=2950107 RepID=A0ABT0UE04_9BACT|nr:SGNH/GDSL hydrolase family protein [Aporhodopirellula aestuarii]MCM2375289.1 SGNH/GDSL hydrolase family protein [Aporhodopirellula aestuarii]
MPRQTTLNRSALTLLLTFATTACIFAADLESNDQQTQKASVPTVQQKNSDSTLRRVLLIGDSISIAYTPLVQTALTGIAEVERVRGNCQFSAHGAEHAGQWIADKQWDVIHFNFGLWDLYGWKQDGLISVQDYGANLEKIVTTLQPACEVLIFATTTPPCAEPEHKIKVLVPPDKAAAFEAEARRVMKKHGVLVNDLDGILVGRMDELGKAPDDVHYTPEGNRVIADKVASFIDMSLGLLPENR